MTIMAVPPIQAELPLHWDLHPQGTALATQARKPCEIETAPWLPRPDAYVAQAAVILTDVLVGRRPVIQLSRWATPALQQAIARRVARESGNGDRGWGQAITARSVHLQVVGDRVVYVTAVFRVGQRARAIAFRMQAGQRRWLVTELDAP